MIWAILASWKWSRLETLTGKMWLPKHLLPLGDGSTPVTRLAQQMSMYMDQILCIVPTWKKELFETAFRTSWNSKVEVIERAEGWQSFFNDLQALKNHIGDSLQNVVITTGDLVLDTFEVSKFLSGVTTREGKIDIALSPKSFKIHPLKPLITFTSLPGVLIEELLAWSINPESTQSVLRFLLEQYLFIPSMRVRFLDALVNLNSPEDFKKLLQLEIN